MLVVICGVDIGNVLYVMFEYCIIGELMIC